MWCSLRDFGKSARNLKPNPYITLFRYHFEAKTIVLKKQVYQGDTYFSRAKKPSGFEKIITRVLFRSFPLTFAPELLSSEMPPARTTKATLCQNGLWSNHRVMSELRKVAWLSPASYWVHNEDIIINHIPLVQSRELCCSDRTNQFQERTRYLIRAVPLVWRQFDLSI